jgi:hypothetical protein
MFVAAQFRRPALWPAGAVAGRRETVLCRLAW